jgi:hypothetical protein
MKRLISVFVVACSALIGAGVAAIAVPSYRTPESTVLLDEPCRLLDTRRTSDEPKRLLSNFVSVIECFPGDGADAVVGVKLNVTAVEGESYGWIRVAPLPETVSTSTVNFQPGLANANSIDVATAPDVQLQGAPGNGIVLESNVAVHVVLDVMGYYLAAPGEP